MVTLHTTGSSAGTWKYRFGLLLIMAVTLIWVGSAEVTQLIFEKYRHPFLLTWLGASLLAFYLPVAYLKECLMPYWEQNMLHTPKGSTSSGRNREREREKASVVASADVTVPGGSTVPRVKGAHSGPMEVELAASKGAHVKARGHVSPRAQEGEDEESVGLLAQSNGDGDGHTVVAGTEHTSQTLHSR